MQGMPVVTDEHKRLHVLTGSWIGEETLSNVAEAIAAAFDEVQRAAG